MASLDLETTDRGEAEAFLNELYSLEIDPPDPGQSFGLHFTSHTLDRVAVIRTRFEMQFSFNAVEPAPQTIVGSLRGGRLAYQIGDNDNRWRPGDVFVAVDAGRMWNSVLLDCDADLVSIDAATFATVAQTANRDPVAITGYTPVSASAAQLWLATSEYARQAASQHAVSPLVADLTAKLLAATALAAFPNNAQLEPTIEDRHDARPANLRRAVAFIESHPDQQIGVVDIARAAYVTPRAVQLAFRRHLDTTPMTYLRRVRLERAHVDLTAADPEISTVTSIAARWGFASPGHFAAYYQHAYGRPPKATLDDSRGT